MSLRLLMLFMANASIHNLHSAKPVILGQLHRINGFIFVIRLQVISKFYKLGKEVLQIPYMDYMRLDGTDIDFK